MSLAHYKDNNYIKYNNYNKEPDYTTHTIHHKIYIDRLFPDVRELGLQHKLKINLESIMYITIPYDAERITKIIRNHLEKFVAMCEEAVITDGTAGVGGNTISFVRNFKKVHAIELDQERFNYLCNNVNLYEQNNVKFYKGDSMEIIPKLEQDVIFIDPPWGGKCYKNKNNIKLCFGELSIEDLCLKFLDKDIMEQVPKLIVLKLPKNCDVKTIYNKIVGGNKVYYYGLNKMIILVIENCHQELSFSSVSSMI
ncbi:MAG: putative RNA methylase [Harvfovirus sp.]|uniref:Putative RNA methylase n=1 Tax=Harvfovirus sp. TaxID=2487768 RepID=A0A3G5A725_9VIRU|nr:MAG: putative RNA methylase [Harvfovirus sp.]